MKQLLPLLLLCGLCHAPFAAAPPPKSAANGPQPAPDGSRFLFVVDTSSSMRPIEEATRQALFDMIFTGLDGQMRTGDTFGLWTFSEETRAGDFPMQVWDGQNPMDTASRVAVFLRGLKFSGQANTEELAPKLRAVARAVGDVNIFILSAGAGKFEGSNFDDGINAEYQKRGKERSRAKKPFVTALIARGGKIGNAYVAIAGQPLPLPNRPLPVVAATKHLRAPDVTNATSSAAAPASAAAVVHIVTNPPPAPNTAPPVSPAPEPPVQAANAAPTVETSLTEVAVTPAPAAPRSKVMQIITRSNTPPPTPEPAPIESVATVATSAPPVVAAIATNPLAVVAQALPVSELVIPARPPPKPIPPVLAALLPAPTPVTAREPAAEEPAAPPEVAAVVIPLPSASQGSSATLLFVIGGLLLAFSIFLVAIVLLRLRPASQPSFITQSMDRR